MVIYKVDRLSRSLLDFARLMATFEEREISLVSVTQQFNTTASLGRLTLNILLSFAQFERELIAERTRDKMSAARRKGKWVGGTPVLGYDVAPGGGKLVVNEEEAQQVRAAFVLYREHRTLAPVLQHIHQQQWTTKRWTTRSGTVHGGRAFSGRDLIRLLNNVIYIGKVHSQGQTYPGEHAAIIEEKDWHPVQEMLQRARQSAASLMQHGDRKGDIAQASVQPENPVERLPRITRLLALAVKFEALIQRGVVKDYAELARLGQVSRARVTQIMNLLNLSPYIQEQILFWAQGSIDKRSIRETTVRGLSSELNWNRQRERWEEILRVSQQG